MSKRNLIFTLFAILWLGTNSARAEQLTYGKYFGTIQMDGQPEAIAVSLDAFIVQINDPTVYPALDVLVRVNLGGYSSSEYVGFHYYDPTFNFEKGILQLNDSADELTATLQVSSTESETILEGPVTHRPTRSKGKMRVVMKLFGAQPVMPDEPLMSVLKGEYSGKCGSDEAELQIETGRGLGAKASGNALLGYSITGRMGYTNGPLCESTKANKYCSLYTYSSGTYSPFTNRITMQGPRGTLDCKKESDVLKCVVAGYAKKGPCTLTRKSALPTGPTQFPAGISLNIAPELKTPLPAPLPPGNDELVSALNGNFYGFLHYENRDVYQLIEMGIVATTSTENPHIENQVIIEPTIHLRLGSYWDSGPALSLLYPQRVFWMSTGFAIQSEGNDHFAVIDEWRKGYVKGVIYSRSFGRVGTFEMQKGMGPEIPENISLLPDPTGSYRGPKDSPVMRKDFWSITIEAPNLTSGPDEMGFPLLGSYSGPGILTMFDEASLDLNTDALSFLIKNPFGDRMVTGKMISGGNLKLLWPVGTALGAPMSGYGSYTYSRMLTKQGEKK